MDQHRRVGRIPFRYRLKRTMPRLLPRGPSIHNSHFGQIEALHQSFKVLAVLRQNGDDDTVDFRVLLEVLQRVNDDRLAVNLEELLRHRFEFHPGAHSAGKDHRDVHE